MQENNTLTLSGNKQNHKHIGKRYKQFVIVAFEYLIPANHPEGTPQ